MNIKTIQQELKKQKLSGRIYTLGNLFINEDILSEENQIEQLTGFTGSYALLFITPDKAYLFVDGRYEVQAKKEVNLRQTEIVKLSEISFYGWLKKHFSKIAPQISYNPWLISLENLDKLSKALPKAKFIADDNAEICLSTKKVKTFAHQKKLTGLTAKEKIAELTTYLKKNDIDAFLVTSASNVSWLLNKRSHTLPYSPILRAYALIEKNGTYKIFAEHTDDSTALPFKELKNILPNYKKLAADFSITPAIIQTFAPELKHLHDETTNLKAIKNQTELKGIRNAHLRDGVALTKFMFWLSKNYNGKTETEIAEKLLNFRKKELNFFSESFATIAGFGAHAAIVHYHAKENTASVLKKNNVLLIDSGGQYYDGTTDVTRTISLGMPTGDMIEKNTLVLKAHIALASAVFPKKTTGYELDLIARQPLLKQNLNYEHGTGHGVGFFSNVHEGPFNISMLSRSNAVLEANMVTSIEPGFYKENAFGIRIENLYYVKPNKNPKFLNFEVLTLAPIDKRLINKYLLTTEELNWLNHYHQQVLLSLKKYLTKQEFEWLKDACAPL